MYRRLIKPIAVKKKHRQKEREICLFVKSLEISHENDKLYLSLLFVKK